MSKVIPLQPLGATVVVLPHQTAPVATESGIQLADVYDDTETSGTVIAIGTGFRCSSCECARDVELQVGDRVLFGRGAGSEIDGSAVGVVGETFLLLQESELLAVVSDGVSGEVV